MIELVNLSKTYKNMKAVNQMNMYIEKGEIIGLLGPNGAGKSTAISMLSTLIEPTEGDVLYKQKSVLKQPGPLRNVIGFVPQEIALYEDLSAFENLKFFGRLYRLTEKKLATRIEEVLQLVGLVERKKELVKRFSGGMKRRLNIGVALLHEPEIIIMDEPTVGIDPQSRRYILETVKQLNEEKGITILYTSHYMEEVEYLCDRIYIMDEGHLIAVGSKKEILDVLSSEHTIYIETTYLKENFIDKITSELPIKQKTIRRETLTLIIPKETDVFDMITSIANECGVHLQTVMLKTPTLEDVFLHLTGRALRD
ncbi:MAG TPA: ABC transporter ATP-binding protein [Pseudogracilibacillus sp.]|nr:ABC transporter ATP-binding protein [Pseudogracilibacillus sp.]